MLTIYVIIVVIGTDSVRCALSNIYDITSVVIDTEIGTKDDVLT